MQLSQVLEISESCILESTTHIVHSKIDDFKRSEFSERSHDIIILVDVSTKVEIPELSQSSKSINIL